MDLRAILEEKDHPVLRPSVDILKQALLGPGEVHKISQQIPNISVSLLNQK